MSKLDYTSLDFNDLKQKLIEYLQSQSEFQDYDFSGSGLQALLNVLSYNSSINAFYANMIANEMFLDSAIQRDSVVSRAKQIGYVPTSVISAKATIKLQFFPSGNPPSIFIPKGTSFNTILDGKVYNFNTAQAYTVFPDNLSNYIIQIEIFEGTHLTETTVVDFSLPEKQKFILPNTGVDINQLTVSVQQSITNSTTTIFRLYDDLNTITPTSPIYFIQEITGEQYQIIFGDGILGLPLQNGNVVIIDYFVSSGPAANGANKFSLNQTIAGYSGTLITTIEASAGGTSIEDIDSIKFLAPLAYQTQNRAVNAHDYETLLIKDYPDIKFVNVWGGEDNIPAQYGKVFVCVQPVENVTFSVEQKQYIINSIVRQRNVISLEAVLVDPDYIRIVPTTEVHFNSSITNKTSQEISNEVLLAIQAYRDSELQGFGTQFRFSKLSSRIDAADQSITENILTLKLKYRTIPTPGVQTLIQINFNTEIDMGDSANGIYTLNSTAFIYKGLTSYLGDDGKGNIYIYRIFNNQRVVFQTGLGSINYKTGEVVVQKLTVDSLPNNFIDIYVTPKIPDVSPVRNQILLIQDEDITINVVDESK